MSVLDAAMVLALAVNPMCGGAAPGSELAERLVWTARHESGFNPLAIGTVGGAPRFADVASASVHARALDTAGRDYDAGLMQINRRNFTRHGLTVETAFDKCASMRAAADHLAADFRAAAWTLAHRRYNCGGFDCGKAYADAVEALGRRSASPALAPGAGSAPPACPEVDPDGWHVRAVPKGCPAETKDEHDE